MKNFIVLFVLFFATGIFGNHRYPDVYQKIKQRSSHVAYQVYIRDFNEPEKTPYGCSGAIIDRLHILTNSACIKNETKSYSIGIYTNPRFNSNASIFGPLYKVEKIIRCEETDEETCSNQMIILELKKPINYSKYQQPIIMAEVFTENLFKIGEFMNESKVNLTNQPPLFHGIKLTMNFDNLNGIHKKEWNSSIYPGSPMVYKNKLIGIFNGKIDNSSSIDYVPIVKYKNWIKKIIKQGHKVNNISQDQSIYQVLVRTNAPEEFGAMELWNGVIIDSTHILTEAYCLTNVKGTQVMIFSNINLPYDEAITIDVSKVIPHPSFDGKTGKHNIAILELKKRIIFSPNLQPAFLQYSTLKNDDVVSLNKWILSFNGYHFGKAFLLTKETNITSVNDDNTIDLKLESDTYVGHWSIAMKDGEIVGVNCLGIDNKNYRCMSVSNYKDWIVSTINNSQVY